MTQVRIQKLWRGHMTRWTQIMELTTSYDALPLDITTLLWCDSVLKTRKKVRRKREEELIFIGMVSKTTDTNPMTMTNDKNEYQPDVVRFFSKTEHVEQNISRIDINPMTMTNGKNEYQPDVVRFLKFNQIEFCSDASSRVLDCLSKQAWADLRISTGTPGGWRIWDSINQIKQLVWSNVHNFEQSFWSLFVFRSNMRQSMREPWSRSRRNWGRRRWTNEPSAILHLR